MRKGQVFCFCFVAVHLSFIAIPHPGFAPYRPCIVLESNLASSLVNARKLYYSALKSL
ncbi:hypothetical protein RchiOBHm_Chr0c11g0499491 [Rosa chinensis]|uniref:Uncharacterized protein n=1 Tax=Rosa chinensis TaxID=74649 RepID=A0A2P6SQS0_ROSCH|nr:hypothetical protein RchiOBHm_Chr0c11g0499491 [Rosa chinensis]